MYCLLGLGGCCPVLIFLCPVLNVMGGHGREPGVAEALSGPVEVVGVAGWGEGIAVEDGADITGWLIRERVGGQEAECAGVVVEEFLYEGEGPGIFVGCGHSGEPHLPIQAELIWCDLWWSGV